MAAPQFFLWAREIGKATQDDFLIGIPGTTPPEAQAFIEQGYAPALSLPVTPATLPTGSVGIAFENGLLSVYVNDAGTIKQLVLGAPDV